MSAHLAVCWWPVVADEAVLQAWERRYLSAGELALLGPSATRKRRADFVAGRVAAKGAVRRLFALGDGGDRRSVVVLREEGEAAGRPYALRGGRRLDAALSISHADGIAVAAACRERVGLDLVAVEALGEPFAEEAFRPGELARWSAWLGAPPEHVACTAFAAKEAALKWLGCGLRVPLRSVTIEPLGARGDSFRVAIQCSGRSLSCTALLSRGAQRTWIVLWGPKRERELPC